MKSGTFGTIARLLRHVPPARLAALGGLIALASLTEGIGLMLLVPLIGLVDAGTGAATGTAGWMAWLGRTGIPLSVEFLLALFVALVALRSLIQFVREQVGIRIERSLVDGLRARAYAALLHAEWRWLAQSTRADHAHVLLSNVDRVGVGVTYGIAFLAGLASLLTYGLVALWLSPVVTAIVALNGAIVFALLSAHRRRALQMGMERTASGRAMHATVDQGLSGIKLTKILSSEQGQIDRFAAVMAAFRKQALAYQTSLGLSRALFQLGAAALLAFYLYLGLSVWKMPLPELATLVLLFARAVPMLMGSQQALFVALHAVPALQDVEQLLDETERAAEPRSAAVAGQAPHWTLERELRLDRVGVTWPERDRPALQDVSIVLPARTTLAVIGPSGSGKSTLADVVMGLLTPDTGALVLDGRPVGPNDRASWRRAVAYVPQETFLANDTIRANLSWGLDRAAGLDGEHEAMDQALRQAGAEFVFDLPAGLDTRVGDGGQRLSGGERQRIALARALLRRPALLILDEATSALDVDNERRIRDTIERLHGDLTMIVIGHRLPTLEQADQVVRLEEGRIVALGTWAQVGGLGKNGGGR